MRTASLRIHSSNLNPVDITEALQTAPTDAFEKGTLCSPRNPRSQRRETALWTLKSDLNEESSLSEHINSLLFFIEEKKEKFKMLAPSCLFDIFCGLSVAGQVSFTLESALLQKTDIIPLNIIFDLYGEGDND